MMILAVALVGQACTTAPEVPQVPGTSLLSATPPSDPAPTPEPTLPPSLGGVGEPLFVELPDTGTVEETGSATWLCDPPSYPRCIRGYGPLDRVAAIDRKDSRFRKGDRVRVSYRGRSVVVTIRDVCKCRGARIIDLHSGPFRRLAPTSVGVLRGVTLEAVGSGARPTLPPTDALPTTGHLGMIPV